MAVAIRLPKQVVKVVIRRPRGQGRGKSSAAEVKPPRLPRCRRQKGEKNREKGDRSNNCCFCTGARYQLTAWLRGLFSRRKHSSGHPRLCV